MGSNPSTATSNTKFKLAIFRQEDPNCHLPHPKPRIISIDRNPLGDKPGIIDDLHSLHGGRAAVVFAFLENMQTYMNAAEGGEGEGWDWAFDGIQVQSSDEKGHEDLFLVLKGVKRESSG